MSKAEDRALERFPVHEGASKEWIEIHLKDICAEYIEGYHQAEEDVIDNLWHDPDEVPEIERKIIWESENFLGERLLDGEWKPMIDCFGRKERWCYLADILPSKNWAGERPYSKVDYSRGYDDGYEQAEKDLELTWEDIDIILKISPFVDEQHCDNNREFCEEVLKRFKERKGE